VYNKAKFEQFSKEYPDLFKDPECFCVSYPDGWDEVLRGLCEDLMVMKRDVLPDVYIAYVKQKYAQIRLHIRSEAFDRLIGEERSLRRQALMEIEADAEYRSRHTCELCGAGYDDPQARPPIAWSVSIGGWERTLCEEHFISECRARGVSILCPDERW